MALSSTQRELRERFFQQMCEAVRPWKAGPDDEVALEALIEASQMLTEHLQQELAELRLEQVA